MLGVRSLSTRGGVPGAIAFDKEVVVRRASWIVLAAAGVLTLLASLLSVRVAYFEGSERIGGVSIEKLAEGRPEVLTALRARRATAAAFAAGFGVLLLGVAVGPYRRGERGAWWAILAATVTLALITLARIPYLDTRAGTAAALLLLAVVVVGLALDPRPLRAVPPASLPS
jgi:hypothetical protein